MSYLIESRLGISFYKTEITRKKHTANIKCNVDEPSTDCDRTGEPLPLPNGDAVVGNLSDPNFENGAATLTYAAR